MIDRPHDSWAEVYDYAYEASFGAMYQSLTNRTVQFVKDHACGGARILDLGAGTGRLSIPLAEMGFDVTAVDASKSMLDVLSNKDIDKKIFKQTSLLQDLNLGQEFDAVLCVFSVFCYITEREHLRSALKNLCCHVKRDGFAFIDVPIHSAFAGLRYNDQFIKRKVLVKNIDENRNIYEYNEHISISNFDERKDYHDQFIIRYWEPDFILSELEEMGMKLAYDASLDFSGSGAHYFKLTW